MSLIKQLWIAIIAITALALGGSLVVSTLTARQYLEEQLNNKNSDNATVLAQYLSMSLLKAGISTTNLDRAAIELELRPHIDLGQYREIRFVISDGSDDNQISLLGPDTAINDVPSWFVKMAAIEEIPGVAHVMVGWNQIGTLHLASRSDYVYVALWKSTQRLLLWFFVTAVIAGLAGSILLLRITDPLRTLVRHAQAIGERRFITTPEPSALELKAVVRAMNTLSERVRQMLAEEAQRLENLRRQIHEDPVTSLLERRQFLNAFSSRLDDPEASAQGGLLILRVCKLIELNHSLGRAATDKLLRSLAEALMGDSGNIGGRLNGSDLVLLAPPAAEFTQWATAIAARAHDVANKHENADALVLPIAAVSYSRSDAMPTVLARLDTVLAQAELEGSRAQRIEEHHDATLPARTQEQWREILTTALEQKGLQLGTCPVRTLQGKLIHNEVPVELAAKDGTLFKTGDFLPWAARLDLIGRMDCTVTQAALERVHTDKEPISVTISAQTLQDGRCVTELITLLRASPELVERLWLEIPEEGAMRNPAAFHAFCLAIKPFACKLGIKHAGPRFSALGDLHDLGLDYLKVDTSLLRDIESNEGNQNFVRNFILLAHTLGLIVIAEGIDRPEQQAPLADLGFDGQTGRAVD